ncbi:MAG: sulfite exporter TauE/SafE family protein [Sulfurovum sp.]|nr:sulfite exporter TauE/SafE family protein [Sulfurovum sp.]
MGTEQLIIATIILFFSSMTQAMIGFAFNLLAIPLLIWTGFSLAESIVLTVIPIFVQLVTNAWKLRHEIIWDDIKIPMAIRYITLPIGIWLLYTVNNLDIDTIKQFVGIMLLIILAVQFFITFKPRKTLPLYWDILAFGASGVMLGVLGMGGPAIVLWLMAHDWTVMRTRAFITAVFLLASPVQIALLYWKFGDTLLQSFVWGIVATPIVIVGALIGLKIGNSFNKAKLKKTVMFFLFLTAVISIISPYMK